VKGDKTAMKVKMFGHLSCYKVLISNPGTEM